MKTRMGKAMLVILLGASPAWALTETEAAKLVAPDGVWYDYFGRAVAIDGDTAVVGAFTCVANGGDRTGSAYVFTRSGTTWTQQAMLMNFDSSEIWTFSQMKVVMPYEMLNNLDL